MILTMSLLKVDVHKGNAHKGGVLKGNVLKGGVLKGNVLKGGVLKGNVLKGGVLKGNVLKGGVLKGNVFKVDVLKGNVLKGNVLKGDVLIKGNVQLFSLVQWTLPRRLGHCNVQNLLSFITLRLAINSIHTKCVAIMIFYVLILYKIH